MKLNIPQTYTQYTLWFKGSCAYRPLGGGGGGFLPFTPLLEGDSLISEFATCLNYLCQLKPIKLLIKPLFTFCEQ